MPLQVNFSMYSQMSLECFTTIFRDGTHSASRAYGSREGYDRSLSGHGMRSKSNCACHEPKFEYGQELFAAAQKAQFFGKHKTRRYTTKKLYNGRLITGAESSSPQSYS